ncbi:MAG: cytochrome c [Paucimonas sp.]|jgi:cytochrome c556|nr:cytochrome c [Paucimonas sp.]
MKQLFAALAIAAAAVPALAHEGHEHNAFSKPEDAVRYRQAAFSVMGTHFARIGQVVKGEKPFDKAAVQADVAVVEALAKLPFAAFPAGSDLSNSKAKPEVWKEAGKFKAGADKMQGEIAKLSTAAKSGDLNAIKVAFGGVGQSCKSCHDNFKNK